MKLGVIDLGSNTIRLVVYQWDGEHLSTLHNIKRISKNLQFIHDAHMSKTGLDAIVSTVKELLALASVYDVENLHVFATASLRNIKNSHEAKAYLEEELQIPIRVLDGLEESRLGFEGIKRKMDLPLEGLAVDIGGGSTELSYFKYGSLIYASSLPIGSLNLYLNHVHGALPSASEEFMIRLEINQQLESVAWLKNLKIQTLLGIGGSARAIMRIHQARHMIDTSIFDMRVSASLIHEMAQSTFYTDPVNAKIIGQAIPDRFTTVIPGLLILDELIKLTHASDYHVSAYGVREGYLFDKMIKTDD